MEIAAAVAAAWLASGKARVARSRASWLRTETLADEIAVPVVGGRTVWRALADRADVFVVAEHPNFFGRHDLIDGPAADLHIRWWGMVGDLPKPVIKADRACGDLDTAQRLATALRTIPGVKLPHGVPQAPWFVLSLRGSAPHVAQVLAEQGWSGATPLHESFPEFPGGLHLEVAWPRQEIQEIAATIRAALEDVEKP